MLSIFLFTECFYNCISLFYYTKEELKVTSLFISRCNRYSNTLLYFSPFFAHFCLGKAEMDSEYGF